MREERIAVGGHVKPTCLIYLPLSYNGKGPAETCVRLAEHFAAAGLDVRLFLPRARIATPPTLSVTECLPFPLNRAPWRIASRFANSAMTAAFGRAIGKADPARTVAYFWPGSPVALLRRCKALGIPIVREMINAPCALAKRILDAAYERRGLAATHPVTQAAVDHETMELHEYDYVFASNPEVEKELRASGASDDRVLPAAFGWRPERFAAAAAPRTEGRVRATFVGTLCVRKGVLDLMDAWREADVDGELVLAGAIEPQIEGRLRARFQPGRVTYGGFVDDPGTLYRSSDMFVFPTYEEGGPQVTYEAAGCGLPVITTPMGAARLVEHGKTGMIVPAGDVPALAQAIRAMARDPDARARMAAASRAAAARFTFERVGGRRGELLLEIALGRSPR